MAQDPRPHMKGIVGSLDGDYWIYDSETGFDMTRPMPVTSKPPRGALSLSTTTSRITIDPDISALVIIDMQNFFLSSAVGRSQKSKGLKAEQRLLDEAIPSARKAGIQIVWLNWGLTHEDILAAPPQFHRSFGFQQFAAEDFEAAFSSDGSTGSSKQAKWTSVPFHTTGKDPKLYVGLGCDLGEVTDSDGATLAAGGMLARDQWNTQLTPNLEASYKSSLDGARPDVWIHKTRISGLHDRDTAAMKYFQQQGIKTLLFAGVNTDQCVGGSIFDAFSYGFDCIMLSDGCATSSPQYAQDCWEFNGARMLGFTTDCARFRADVEASLHK